MVSATRSNLAILPLPRFGWDLAEEHECTGIQAGALAIDREAHIPGCYGGDAVIRATIGSRGPYKTRRALPGQQRSMSGRDDAP